MNVCFLVSGIARSFFTNLHLYFIELSTLGLVFDVYINFAEEQSDKLYFNKSFDIELLKQYSFYKSIEISNSLEFNLENIQQKNILNQWFRLKELYNSITNEYTSYIRLRPDIKLLINPSDLITLIHNCNEDKIYIPNGYDFYNGYQLSSNSNHICINDQIAISNKRCMNLYARFFNAIMNNELYKYLIENSIIIERIVLPYTIVLSECKVISISGDSGSGKSTLTKALESLFLFDSYLTIETDRYHKWERNSSQWKNYTHLNPEANCLEKMSEDVFRLKLGESVFSVDYDHTTGKFTEEKKLEAKPYILLCGLHTLYEKNIRDISELKIFLDTDSELKDTWKIQRDMIERKHSKEKIIESINKRKNDYLKYIYPQKLYSDIIIEYKDIDMIEIVLHINNKLNYYINPLLCQISSTNNTSTYKKFHTYIIDKSKVNISILKLFIKNESIIHKLKDYPLNIIQSIVYLSLIHE